MQILKIKTERRMIGDFGEKYAAKLLRKKGYRIVKRGYVAAGHEIDIVAQNRESVIFVEVKTRTVGKEDPRSPRPASAVTPDKQRGIITAAKYYMAGCGRGKSVRLDVIEVYLNREGKRPKVERAVHMEGAFNYNTAHPKGWRKD